MEVEPIVVVAILALTALTVLLTGPGLWSEKWGWWWLKDRKGKGPDGGKPEA